MAKPTLTYTLGSLSFSTTVLQAVLKVFRGQNWYSTAVAAGERSTAVV